MVHGEARPFSGHSPLRPLKRPAAAQVDVTYKAHLAHPPTLLLLKTLAAAPTLPAAAAYIGEAGHRAIQGMALIKSGRLSEWRSVVPVVRAVR